MAAVRPPGSGSAIRSTFPVGVSGSWSSRTKNVGIMKSGKISASLLRSSAAVGAGAAAGTT